MENKSGGIGFVGVLTAIFIGLKLANVIDWPWIWVLSPIWIGWAILFVFGMLAVIVIEIMKKMEE